MAEELKDKQKKVLLGYNECAREIQKANPLVAFYCRMYGVEQALSFGTKDMNAGIRNFIEAEFVDLEKTKPTLGISAATREADAETCREFAKTVFNAADKRDRSGLPEHILPAAISFKRAAQFFNVATQFGPLPDTYAQLKKYALWRSLELTKAHKEGRAPEPPPQAQLEEDADRDLMAALNALPGKYIVKINKPFIHIYLFFLGYYWGGYFPICSPFLSYFFSISFSQLFLELELHQRTYPHLLWPHHQHNHHHRHKVISIFRSLSHPQTSQKLPPQWHLLLLKRLLLSFLPLLL